MTDVGWAVFDHARGGGWHTTLYTPTYPGSGRYVMTDGPITSTTLGFEGAAAWLRDQGYEITAWKERPLGGFRAELRKM